MGLHHPEPIPVLLVVLPGPIDPALRLFPRLGARIEPHHLRIAQQVGEPVEICVRHLAKPEPRGGTGNHQRWAAHLTRLATIVLALNAAARSGTVTAMSRVADVLLSVEIEDTSLAGAFSEWLRTEAPRQEPSDARGVGFLKPLNENPEIWGGWKYPESYLWGGAMNHASIADIVKRFAQTPWSRPETAQLLIRDQEQGAFRLWMIRDGRAQQFVPLPDLGPDE